MKLIKGDLLLFYSMLIFTYQAYAQPLLLVVPQYPPFTSEIDGEFHGIGIHKINQLLEELAINYQLRSVPNYDRALEELKQGKADGFFLATENEQRNNLATLSEPIMYNAWTWFLTQGSNWDPKSEDFRKHAKIATTHDSNTRIWLNENKYNVVSHPHTPCYLPRMLIDLQRVDAVFLASKVFKKELLKQGYPDDVYREIVQISKPFGIYISNDYLALHPEFMTQLNQAILKITANKNAQ